MTETLTEWRLRQREQEILTADDNATAFYNRILEHPIRLLTEWAGHCPYGTPEHIHDLNRRYWKARHRAASHNGINLTAADQSHSMRVSRAVEGEHA